MQLDFQFGAQNLEIFWSSLQLDEGLSDPANAFLHNVWQSVHGPRGSHALAIHGNLVIINGPKTEHLAAGPKRFNVNICTYTERSVYIYLHHECLSVMIEIKR